MYDVREFGVVADGKTDNTEAFQRALDHVRKHDGGTLSLPAGTIITRDIEIPRNVQLRGAATRESVIAEAESWIGTPFVPEARACIKGVGTDCGRLLVGVYRDVGVKTPTLESLPNFGRGWFLHKAGDDYLTIVSQFAREVPGPQPGDIVMYKLGRQWAHAGIIIAWPKIVHAIDPIVQFGIDGQIPHVSPRAERKFLSPFA